jgi:hypothetical protein
VLFVKWINDFLQKNGEYSVRLLSNNGDPSPPLSVDGICTLVFEQPKHSKITGKQSRKRHQ